MPPLAEVPAAKRTSAGLTSVPMTASEVATTSTTLSMCSGSMKGSSPCLRSEKDTQEEMSRLEPTEDHTAIKHLEGAPL